MIMIADEDLDRIRMARQTALDLYETITDPIRKSWGLKAMHLLDGVLINIAALQMEKAPSVPQIAASPAPTMAEVLAMKGERL